MSSRTPAAAVRRPLTEYPGGNSFASDLVSGGGAASRFVQPFSLVAAKDFERTKRSDHLAAALDRTNRLWGNDVSAELEAWRRGETVPLVAGQQVGFAGGPSYTLAKIASLIALRDRLKAQGVAATPFFWMATEDHDWDEVARIVLHGKEGIRRLEARKPGVQRMPVGPLEIPESLIVEFLAATGIERPHWLEPAISFGESFAKLIVEVLKNEKVVLVDALLPELRNEGSPLFQSILRRADECAVVLENRQEQIRAAGYRPQVEPSADGSFTLLYLIGSRGEREPLRRERGQWLAGGRKLETEQLLSIAEREPQRISTAALTRPLLQDSALGAGVFVGGPAEVAYYAQTTALHELFAVRAPQVALRSHVLVASERVMRSIEEHEVAWSELFDPVDEILARREPQRINALESALATLRDELTRGTGEVRAIVARADAPAEKGIEKSLRKIDYHLARIASRGRTAIARRDENRMRAIRRINEMLAPAAVPQDRLLGWYPLYLRFGDALLRGLIDEGEPQRDTYSLLAL